MILLVSYHFCSVIKHTCWCHFALFILWVCILCLVWEGPTLPDVTSWSISCLDEGCMLKNLKNGSSFGGFNNINVHMSYWFIDSFARLFWFWCASISVHKRIFHPDKCKRPLKVILHWYWFPDCHLIGSYDRSWTWIHIWIFCSYAIAFVGIQLRSIMLP